MHVYLTHLENSKCENTCKVATLSVQMHVIHTHACTLHIVGSTFYRPGVLEYRWPWRSISGCYSNDHLTDKRLIKKNYSKRLKVFDLQDKTGSSNRYRCEDPLHVLMGVPVSEPYMNHKRSMVHAITDIVILPLMFACSFDPSLPSHDEPSMPPQNLLVYWLSEDICWLHCCVDWEHYYFSSRDIISEMMESLR